MRAFWKTDTFCSVAAILIGTFLLGFIFWHHDPMGPTWAVSSFVLVYDPDMRAAFGTAIKRLAYTFLGVALAIATLKIFGTYKWVLPLGLAITTLVCGLFLPSRASWRVVLVTVCLIIGSALVEQVPESQIAFSRAVEVAVGSAMAVIFALLVGKIRQNPEPKSERNVA